MTFTWDDVRNGQLLEVTKDEEMRRSRVYREGNHLLFLDCPLSYFRHNGWSVALVGDPCYYMPEKGFWLDRNGNPWKFDAGVGYDLVLEPLIGVSKPTSHAPFVELITREQAYSEVADYLTSLPVSPDNDTFTGLKNSLVWRYSET